MKSSALSLNFVHGFSGCEYIPAISNFTSRSNGSVKPLLATHTYVPLSDLCTWTICKSPSDVSSKRPWFVLIYELKESHMEEDEPIKQSNSIDFIKNVWFVL